MRRNRILDAALLLALCLALSGCGSPAEPAGTGDAAEPAYDDSLIDELVYETDYTEEGWEEPMHLTYHLPLLRADTPDALAFNESLRKLRDDAEAGNISYDTVSWERHWNGSLLSLVLCLRTPYQRAVEYCACSYDASEGRTLSNRELLDRAGLTLDVAEDTLRRAAAQKFDADSLPLPELYGECFDGLLELRARTISRSNLAIDRVPLFLGEGGVLHAMAQIGTPAGGGNYMADLALEPEPGERADKTVTLGNLTAELADGQVTLTFSEMMRAGESFLSGVNIDYETPYPVLGLYGDYTDLALGYVGNDGTLLLCLTDTNGQVSVCDLTAAALSGAPFCVTGPLPELRQVIGFETAHDISAHDLLACLSNGEKVSVYDAVNRAAVTVPLSVQVSAWLTPDGVYTLNFHRTASGFVEAVWGGGGGVLGSGYLFYDGMTEDGLRFQTTLDKASGGSTELLLTFTSHTDVANPEVPTTLTVKQLSGDLLSGIPRGSDGVVMSQNWEVPAPGAVQEIRVSTADELIQAIGSNVRILLAPGVYDLSAWVEEVYDGTMPDYVEMDWDRSLCLTGLRELSLLAEQPGQKTELVVTNEHIPVLTFSDCEGLRLFGLTLGHAVAPGSCTGSVLKLDECTGVTLEQVDLYGCGTYGLEAYGGDDLHMRDSTVHDCTYGALSLMLCAHADFHGCSFLRCGGYTVLDSSGGELRFIGCTLRENRGTLFPQPGEYDQDSRFYFEGTEFGRDEALQLSGNELVTVRETC